jgi:hypothetical protein
LAPAFDSTGIAPAPLAGLDPDLDHRLAKLL